MSASNYVHIDVDEIVRITDAAMLIRQDDEEIWLPLSQVADAEAYAEGDTDLTLSVTAWIAAKKGLG